MEATRRSVLLDSLPTDVLVRLAPDLHSVELPAGKVLCAPGAPPGCLYFLRSGIVSMLYVTTDGDAGEVATVGNEGMVGITLLIGSTEVASRAVVQSPGEALVIKAEAAEREFRRGGAFQAIVLRYTHWLLRQLAQAAICSRHHTLERQLCRWLLQGFDGLGTPELRVTHEALANYLGVRREGVTEAAGRLQEAGAIRYSRGCIRLIDRACLEQRACECYPLLKRDYARLVAPA